MLSLLEQAVTVVTQAGLNATKQAVRAAYEQLVSRELSIDVLQPQPHLLSLPFPRLLCSIPASREQELEQEIELLESKLERKRAELLEVRELLGVASLSPTTFLLYSTQFLEENVNRLKPASQTNYRYMLRAVEQFDSQLRLEQITKTTLLKLESFLVKQGRKNSTIAKYISLVKSVVYYFQDTLGLTTNIAKYEYNKNKKEDNVVYLTKEELAELNSLKERNEKYAYAKDLFCFMCYTGLRYSDVFLQKHQLKQRTNAAGLVEHYAQVTTRKGNQKLEVPLIPQAYALLEKHGFCFPVRKHRYFNDMLTTICARLTSTSAHELTTVINYCGSTRLEVTQAKHLFYSAHTGRRTFINLQLENGIDITKLKGITGHGDFNMLARYASKKSKSNAQVASAF